MNLSRLLAVGVLALLPLVGDDDPVATTRDATFTRAEYGRWLIERYGHVYLDDFTTEQLVLIEAERRGLMPTEEEADAAWRREFDIVLEHHHKGDVQAWRDSVRNTGQDPETYADRRRSILRNELAHVALAKADRTFTDEDIARRYKDIYGDAGESVSFDVLFYSAYASVDPGGPRQDVQQLRQAAMARAREAAAALRDGALLADLVEDSDPLVETARESELIQGQRVIQYRARLLGTEVDRAVKSLDDPGDVAGPIQVFDGAYVLQLVRRQSRTAEEARPEIEAILRDTPPTADELNTVRERLMAQEELVKTLR